jgi:membrane fusion protein (multidrug efflux system)
VTGIIDRILFEEGQVVPAGQVLVQLDAAERQADLEAARAAIETAQAQRNELMQRLDRARQLRTTGAGTEAQVADLQLQVRTAESNIVASQARERAAAARLDDLVVRAPFEGRVGLRQVSIGALLENKTPITTLDDLSQVRLDFGVPEVLLSRLRVGTPVRTQTVAFGARVFEGSVSFIDTRVDPLTRSVKLTALLPNPDRSLRPGMFMNVSLTVAVRENTVVLPEEAILGEGPRQVAFIVKDGKVERRVLRTGQRQPGRIEVLEGVEPGEMLIVRGLQRVRHGIEVTVRPYTAPPRSDANAQGAGTAGNGRAQAVSN